MILLSHAKVRGPLEAQSPSQAEASANALITLTSSIKTRDWEVAMPAGQLHLDVLIPNTIADVAISAANVERDFSMESSESDIIRLLRASPSLERRVRSASCNLKVAESAGTLSISDNQQRRCKRTSIRHGPVSTKAQLDARRCFCPTCYSSQLTSYIDNQNLLWALNQLERRSRGMYVAGLISISLWKHSRVIRDAVGRPKSSL